MLRLFEADAPDDRASAAADQLFQIYETRKVNDMHFRLASMSETSQSAIQAIGFDRLGTYVFSVQGRRLLGKAMAHFNYEMLTDIKLFIF